MPRIRKLIADGADRNLPPLPGEARHLLGYLFEVGPAGSGATGASALSWLEIDAWQRSTGVELAPWQARILRRLSVDYVAESRRAESPTALAPNQGEGISQEQRESVADRIRRSMRAERLAHEHSQAAAMKPRGNP